MHILLLTSWYKTAQHPMKGTFFEEQARGLMARGHRVVILYPEFASFNGSNEIKEVQLNDDGLWTYYVPFKSKIPRLKKWNYKQFQKHTYNAFQKYVNKHGSPDIIHVHTVFYAGIAAAYISEKTGIPYVLTEHFTPFITGGITDKVDIDISKVVFGKSKQNIAVSTGFRELLENKLALPEGTFKVIPNMVNGLFLAEDARRKEWQPEESFTFFTMSFLTERKNHRLMLQAFQKFVGEYPNSRFVIGGDGTIRNELEEYIDELGLSTSVVMLGQLSRVEVLNQMKKTHCFLLASTFETFGVVLIEAMACGVPCVSTDSVGPRDIMSATNGKLVESFDPDDFYHAMREVYNNYEEYQADKIYEECKSKYSESVVLEQLERVYNL